jgi:hypothetical protein
MPMTRSCGGPAAVVQVRTMTERTKPKKPASREERLRAALRENLKRRKAQARGRSDDRVTQRNAPGGPEKSGS